MESTRDEIYRAMLEALSERLAEGKRALEDAGGFKTRKHSMCGRRIKKQAMEQAEGKLYRSSS